MPPEELRYDTNIDYNQSIDDEHGEVTIGTESFLPSEILYNLRREAYRIGLDDYKTQKREELKDLVFSEFPSNIAYYFRLSEKGENANNPVIRFLHLKDTWEGRFLYEPVKQRHNISFDALQHRFDAEKQELQNLIVP